MVRSYPDPKTFRRNVTLLVVAACVVRVAIAVVAWREVASLAETSRQVDRSQEALTAVEAERSSLEAVVAAERGYLLTGRPEDLAALRATERVTRQRLALLWDLSSEGARERALREELTPLVEKRLALADAAARAHRFAGLEAGAAELDAALAKLDDLREDKTAQLSGRVRAKESDVARALTGIFTAAVASIIVLVAAALWLLPAFDERVAVRDALRPGRKAYSA